MEKMRKDFGNVTQETRASLALLPTSYWILGQSLFIPGFFIRNR